MGTTGDGRKETFAATARIAEVVGGDVNRETRYSTLRVTERWHRRETPEVERSRLGCSPSLSVSCVGATPARPALSLACTTAQLGVRG